MLLFVDQVLSNGSFRIRWCQWRSLPDLECTYGSVVRICLADLRGEARSYDTLNPRTVFLDSCTGIHLTCFGLPLDRDGMQVTTSGLASLARMPFGLGVSAGDAGRARQSDPPKPLRLYEFEACPFCRSPLALSTCHAPCL